MSLDRTQRARLGIALTALALVTGGAGYYVGSREHSAPASPPTGERQVLYWYDPMFPQQKFDKPGKSPFMDMELLPKYADAGGDQSGSPAVTTDPAAMQNLGIRTAVVTLGTLAGTLDVTGTIDFNQRDVAIIQARSGGFVQRVYGLAPGDVVGAGAPIADLLVPEWGGAQAEFLAVQRLGDTALTAAARQRLRLLGMSDGQIAQVERSRRPSGVVTVTTPIGGVIQTLDARRGMTLAGGQTLAQVTGLGTVWLNAAVPEARAADVRLGQTATAELAGFPDVRFSGRIIAVLPTAETSSRTLTVRIELDNRGGRLRPGMFARVRLGDRQQTALLVPSEAVIRTGTRTLVMLSEAQGRYRPAEVRVGREAGGRTEIRAGLAVGEKIVASGQFLLDSEASLTGIEVRPLDAGAVK